MNEQFGVQPHSQGPIYPAIIYRVDNHDANGNFRYSSWTLLFDGRAESGYASHDDAEIAARELLANPAAREAWCRGE